MKKQVNTRNKTEYIGSFRVDPEVKRRVEIKARRQKRTVTDYIRVLVEEDAEKQEVKS